MGTPDLVFVEASGFYRVKYPGGETFAEFERLFRDMLAHSERTGCNRYLLDLTGLKEIMSFLDKFDLAELIASVIGARVRVSILYAKGLDSESVGKLVFFENVAVNRGGLGLRMMDDEAAAIRWVSA